MRPASVRSKLLAGAVDQLFAEFLFEALKGQRDGGLGAEEFFGGAGKALLRGDGKKDLEGVEFHEVTRAPTGNAWHNTV